MQNWVCAMLAAGLIIGSSQAQDTGVPASNGRLGSYLEKCRDHIAINNDSERCLSSLHDAMLQVSRNDQTICVPFDITKPLNEDYRSMVSWMYLKVDENPRVAREAMREAAFEAMQALWPCATPRP